MITHNPHKGAIDWPSMDPAMWTPEFSVHPLGSVTVADGAEIFMDGSSVEVVSRGRVVTTIPSAPPLVLDALVGIATQGLAPDDLPRGRILPTTVG